MMARSMRPGLTRMVNVGMDRQEADFPVLES